MTCFHCGRPRPLPKVIQVATMPDTSFLLAAPNGVFVADTEARTVMPLDEFIKSQEK